MLIMSTNFISHGPQQSYVLDLDRRSVAEQVSSGINSFDCSWYTSLRPFCFCTSKDQFAKKG